MNLTVSQPDFQLFYGKSNITTDVKPYLKELSVNEISRANVLPRPSV